MLQLTSWCNFCIIWWLNICWIALIFVITTSSWGIALRHTTNSSPPMRAAVSFLRISFCKASPKKNKVSSPIVCPYLSFTSLKSSTSINIKAINCSCLLIYSSILRTHSRRLYKPVKGSKAASLRDFKISFFCSWISLITPKIFITLPLWSRNALACATTQR